MLGVDRCSYYKWLKSGKSKRKEANEKLLILIRREYFKSNCIYGIPKDNCCFKEG